MELRTRRFLLRDYIAADEPAYVAQHTDRREAALRAPEEMTEAHARRIFALFLAWAAERPRRNYQLAVCPAAAPETVIGTAGIRTAGCEPGVAEIGIGLAWEYHGRYRYATEVIEAMLRFGFETLGVRAVNGVTVAANTAVNRLVRHYGFAGTSLPAASPGALPRIAWRLSRAGWEGWQAGQNRS